MYWVLDSLLVKQGKDLDRPSQVSRMMHVLQGLKFGKKEKKSEYNFWPQKGILNLLTISS